jgi:DNA-binding HxlR family transcriptional regulator
MAIRDTTISPDCSGAPRCPISFCLEIFGDRWSLLLIRDMMLRGKKRYRDFLQSEEGISTNILADRLKRMQQMGLVEKFADPGDRKASVYLLTDKGLDLFPVLLEVMRWGMKHDEHSIVPPQVAAALAGSKDDLARQARSQIQSERKALRRENRA